MTQIPVALPLVQLCLRVRRAPDKPCAMQCSPSLAFAPCRVAFLLLSGFLTLSVVALPGCSRQSEGERCSLLNGNSDCEGTDLLCTDASTLRNGVDDGVDRCCYPDRVNDSRCAPRRATGDGDNQGGGASGDGDGDGDGDDMTATGGMGGSGNRLPADASCVYDSQCESGLFCISGRCRVQCNKDIDCRVFGGGTCSPEGSCVQD